MMGNNFYSLHHISLSVSDLEKSSAFYRQLGFVEVVFFEDPEGNFCIKHLKL
jgi:catechol 2,3-dioxygenase-like lactoylglutathione lyase family enzyme